MNLSRRGFLASLVALAVAPLAARASKAIPATFDSGAVVLNEGWTVGVDLASEADASAHWIAFVHPSLEQSLQLMLHDYPPPLCSGEIGSFYGASLLRAEKPWMPSRAAAPKPRSLTLDLVRSLGLH